MRHLKSGCLEDCKFKPTMPMQNHSTSFGASMDATLTPSGPSLKTICMLQMLARMYQPMPLKNGRFDKKSLA